MDYVWQSSQDTIGNDCAGADTRCQFGWIVMAVYTAVRCAVSWREGDNPMIHPLAFYRRNGIFIEFLKKILSNKTNTFLHIVLCVLRRKRHSIFVKRLGLGLGLGMGMGMKIIVLRVKCLAGEYDVDV